MSRLFLSRASSAFWVLAAALTMAIPAWCQSSEGAVWIYEGTTKADKENAIFATQFAPFGFMPKERADSITVNASLAIDGKDPANGKCIEYQFAFDGPDQWAGSYTLVGGSAWGTKAGIDVQKLLKLKPDSAVTLRFKARSPTEATVTFLCGGISDGPFPSSLGSPIKLDDSPCKLGKEFKDYAISLTAKQLTNVIDPFAVTVAAPDSPDSKRVVLHVTDIRFEVSEPAVKPSSTLWRDRLENTCWITYTPSGYDPTVSPVRTAQAKDIRADLTSLRKILEQAGVKERGLVLYGCRDGLEQVPAIAAETGFAVILGLYLPQDAVEVANAARLLKQKELDDTIVACCVGNEALTFHRAKLNEIIAVTDRLMPCHSQNFGLMVSTLLRKTRVGQGSRPEN